MRDLISPCGMIMDSLRSHMVTMTEIADIRGYRVPIRWYPTKPGAKAFPGFHAFIHPVWEEPKTLPPTGPGVEGPDWEARPKRYPKGPGDHYEGPLEWFQKGIPHSLLDDPTFVPGILTCGRPSRTATGGALAGGDAAMLAGVARRAGGGSLGGGTAHVLSPYVKRGAGGALADGTARIVATVVRQGSGGALADGTARVAGQYVRTGSGGALAGGETEGLPALVRYGVGGALAGGTATAQGPGILTICCPQPLPIALWARLSSDYHPEIDGLLLELPWNHNAQAWYRTTDLPVPLHLVASGCGELGWTVYVHGGPTGDAVYTVMDLDCGPPLSVVPPAGGMNLTWGGVFSDPYTVVIGETPPPWSGKFVAFMRAGGDLPQGGADITDRRALKWGDQ